MKVTRCSRPEPVVGIVALALAIIQPACIVGVIGAAVAGGSYGRAAWAARHGGGGTDGLFLEQAAEVAAYYLVESSRLYFVKFC